MNHRLGIAAGSIALVVASVASCSGDDGDAEAFCRQVPAEGQIDAVLDTYDPSDVDGTIEQFEAALAEYLSLRSDAPPEVRDDLDVLIEFLRDFVEGLREVDPTDPEGVTGAAVDLEERFGRVSAATAELEAYVSEDCV